MAEARNTPLRVGFFLSLFVGVLGLTFFMFLPYMVTLAMAATFAVVMQPVYRALQKLLKGKDTLSAIITILLTGLLFILPLTILASQVVRESTQLYTALETQTEGFPGNLIVRVEEQLAAYIPQLNVDVDLYIRQGLQWLTQYIGPFFAGTIQTLLHMFLGIIAFFYFLKDGQRFIATLTDLSPLSDSQDARIFKRLDTAVNSIVKGSLTIALVQGILSGIGLAIFGIPSATLWGSIAAIGALIPGVGTALVLAPSIIYLFLIGNIGSAVGLLIWGATAVGLIDNFLGPLLVGRGVKIHPMLVLFGVIGGIEFFGPLGFLLGPLVLSLLFALTDIYKQSMERTGSPTL